MTTKRSAPISAPKKKLLARIAVAGKQADSAKKSAKLAKLTLRNAKQKFKDAKKAAKKSRKVLKGLKAELAALSVKKSTRKSAAPKRTVERSRPMAASVPVPLPPITNDLPPVAPS